MTRKQFQKKIERKAGKENKWFSIEKMVEAVTLIGEKERISLYAIVSYKKEWGDDIKRTVFYHLASMVDGIIDNFGQYEDINEAYDAFAAQIA